MFLLKKVNKMTVAILVENPIDNQAMSGFSGQKSVPE